MKKKKFIAKLTLQEKENMLAMFDSGMPIKKMAPICDLSAPAISRFLKSNGREIVSTTDKYAEFRKISFTEKQKQFIIGHILGDGGIYSYGKNQLPRLTIGQSIKQEAYFDWKVKLMSPFIMKSYRNEDKRGNSIMMHCSTIVHPELVKYRKMFYSDKKIVPEDIALHLEPLSLAVFVMDDGNLNGPNIRISTMGFGHKDHVILKDAFKSKFNINLKIAPFNYKGKAYLQLWFSKKNSLLLKEIIGENVIKSMRYKLP